MFDEVMPELSTKLTKRFEETFPVPPGPEHDSLQAFSQALTSNIVGGIGYFYGRSIVDRGFAYEWDQEDDEDEECMLNDEVGPSFRFVFMLRERCAHVSGDGAVLSTHCGQYKEEGEACVPHLVSARRGFVV